MLYFSLSKQISRNLQIQYQFRTWLEHHQLRFRIKWIGPNQTYQKVLRTLEKILAPVIISFIHCSGRSSLVLLNPLSTPFINIANCSASFTSVLVSIAKLHDTNFSLCLQECHKYYQQVDRCVLLLSNAINFFSQTPVPSGGYSNLGARGKNFQKLMLSEKKKSFDLGLHIFFRNSWCPIKKKVFTSISSLIFYFSPKIREFSNKKEGPHSESFFTL